MSDPPVEERPAPLKFDDESLSDVTVFVENQGFIVHRMVLACRSDVFKALFYGDFKEAKEDRVVIKEVSADMFGRIVELIYYGKMSGCGALYYPSETTNYKKSHVGVSSIKEMLQKFWDFVNELLAVADGFSVTELVLKNLQEEFIKSKCDVNCNFCLNLYMFAFENKMPILDRFTQSFTKNVYENWSSVVYSESAPIEPLRLFEPKEFVDLIKKLS